MKKWLANILYHFAKKGFKIVKLSKILNKISFKLYPHFRNYNLKGWIELRLNNFANSKECFNKSLELFENEEAKLGIIETLLKQEKYKEVKEYIEEILKENPNSDYIHYYLPASYLKLKRYNQAEQEALKLKREDKFIMQMNLILVQCYLKQRKLNLVKDIIDDLLTESSTKYITKYYLAKYYFLSDKIKQAKKTIDSIPREIREEKGKEFEKLKEKIHKKYGKQNEDSLILFNKYKLKRLLLCFIISIFLSLFLSHLVEIIIRSSSLISVYFYSLMTIMITRILFIESDNLNFLFRKVILKILLSGIIIIISKLILGYVSTQVLGIDVFDLYFNLKTMEFMFI